ncbi:hypothetical protein D3C87_1757200 [compost metagenome]
MFRFSNEWLLSIGGGAIASLRSPPGSDSEATNAMAPSKCLPKLSFLRLPKIAANSAKGIVINSPLKENRTSL